MDDVEGSNENFEKWLDSVVVTFLSLSLAQQEVTLNQLIGKCSPEVRYSLMEYVCSILKRDVFTRLPAELKMKVCSYLDGKSLLTACTVCTSWNRAIRSLEEVWKLKCVQDGFQQVVATTWKEKYLLGLKFLHKVQTGSAFSQQTLRANIFGGDAISSLFIEHDHLFASAGKQVAVWQIGSLAGPGCPALYLTASHHVSSSWCEWEARALVCGHKSGHVSTWTWGDPSDGTAHETASFAAHVGPVTCLAGRRPLCLLVSGGVDRTVKLWCLRTSHRLHTIAVPAAIVTKVMLMPASYPDLTDDSNQYVLLVKSKNVLKLYQWCLKPRNLSTAHECGSLEQIENNIVSIEMDDYHKSFFPDQYCYAQGKLFYVRNPQLPEVLVFDVNKRVEVAKILLSRPYPFALAVGKLFGLMMGESSSSRYNFTLVNVEKKSEVLSLSIPVSRCDRHTILRVAVASTLWLDDIGHVASGRPVLAFTDSLEQINVVFWNHCTAPG